jgi:hypothetical protein
MTRDEMLSRMTSLELSKWCAFFKVKSDERKYAEDVAASGDGIVIDHGPPDDDEDDEEEEEEDNDGSG